MFGPENRNTPGEFNHWASKAVNISPTFNIEASKDRPQPDAERKYARSKGNRGLAVGGARAFNARKGRRSNASKPFSIRMTPAERARLTEDAAGEPLGAYVKKTLFAPTTKAAARRTMIDNHKVMIAQVLAMVGSSGIADALTTMAVAIKMGTLEDEAEILKALNSSQEELAEIRAELLKALDIRKS